MARIDASQRLPPLTLSESDAAGIRPQLAWPGAFVLSLGGALLVTVSLGPMAGDLGPASLIVWCFTALVGLAQCLMIAELATQFHAKVGGVPAYNHEGLKHLSPLFGVLSSWGYWVGWIPGVAVNLVLAATYLKAAFWPDVDVVALTLTLVVALYGLNYFGLRISVWTASLMTACALLPLGVIVGAPIVRSTLWNPNNFWPVLTTDEPWFAPATLLLLAKWVFVAVWSSYGAEMVASVIGEMRDAERSIPKAVGLAAAATLLAFAVVPTVLVGVVGATALAQDPYTVFLTAAREIFGPFGSAIVSIMLIAALVLGAQLFIICSSRALCQMSTDGLTLTSFTRRNRFGVPTGSMGWDAAVTLLLLAIFRDDVVNVVAAANVGYLLVFVLMPMAYVFVRRTRSHHSGTVRLPGFMTPLAWCLGAFNLLIFVVGGAQWGAMVIGLGGLLVLTSLPLYAYRRTHPSGPW